MSYFTWKDNGLTDDCASLEAMASRFEECAKLMRRMSDEGFKLKKHLKANRIIHKDSHIFEKWGFINEGMPHRQLTLMPEEKI